MNSSPRTRLLLIFLVVVIDLLGFGIVLPLLPRYGDYFRASDSWLAEGLAAIGFGLSESAAAHLRSSDGVTLGLLMASFSACQFVFAPIWGRVSDRIGRRPILLLGLAGSTLSYLLFGYVSALSPDAMLAGLCPLGWLFVARIGAGVAGATIPTAQAYIADSTDETGRGKGMALVGAAFGVGFTLGPLLGAAFVSNDRMAPPSAAPGYLAAALSGMAFLLALVRLPESLREQSQAARRGWFSLSEVKAALSRPMIRPLLLTMFLTTFAFAQFESTLSLLTKHFGIAQRNNFLLFAYIGLVLTLSQGILVRRLLPRLGEFRMALTGATLMVAGLVLLGVTAQMESTQMLYAVLPVSVIGFSALTPSLQAMLSLNSSDEEQGGVLGVGQSMTAMARILGPIAGLTLFNFGVAIPYWAAAGVMGLGVLLVAALPAKRPVQA
ncbi:Tetracycline resistance protein, class B [Maioricimonas rarisocia]|uniref:Tetracycline resistance protein, class B n=1 Tax=Maioricimonas rarisocia TaxID=2528026 RepID=A0A517Z7R0_9PLAN|nr:MFS transporter [Maioricimonas rarisocia]QDU38508.1 Tetracycline resistance protein, class B [Maioricimonas rarisocia]